jgi:hypothetical protein
MSPWTLLQSFLDLQPCFDTLTSISYLIPLACNQYAGLGDSGPTVRVGDEVVICVHPIGHSITPGIQVWK